MVWDRILREKAEDEKAACMESADKTMKEAEQIVSAYEEDIECLNSQLYEKDIMIQGLTVENERLRRHITMSLFQREMTRRTNFMRKLLLKSAERQN